jgi:hypothetical protein
MKKRIITISIILGLGLSSFAQQAKVEENGGLFSRGRSASDNRDIELLRFPTYGSSYDSDANQGPLGSGIAMLMGLGAAYMVAKKRKED